MRFSNLIAAAALLLGACGSREDAPAAAPNGKSEAPPAPSSPANTASAAAARPDLQSSSAGAAPARAPVSPPLAASSPCLTQGGERLQARPLRAVGTEPFWGARIEGRCVTYSHMEDQSGTRIWTRFTPGPGGGTWSGALGGRRFELRTRAQPGCSDGMSDKLYPIAVDLLVGGERRSGCAEPG